MSLARIKDQEVAVRLLTNVLQRNRIPNAMLFWGPPGVGKFTTAMEMAKAVNCREEAANACDECLQCRKVASGNHPDVRVVVPAAKSRMIIKEHIEEVNELASLRPYESKWRVFIFEDADRMNIRAQNYFLKTLEEPPGQSLFILLTQFPRTLFATIRSRCQMVRFRMLTAETVSALLQEHRDVTPEVAQAVAEVAEGQMTRAIDLVETERRDVILSVIERLAGGDDPVSLAEEFAKHLADKRKQIEAQVNAELKIDRQEEVSREDLEKVKEERLAQMNAVVKRDILEYLYLMETWYRDELIYTALGDSNRVWNRDQVDRLASQASSDPGSKILAIERARTYLDRFIPEDRVFRDLFFTLSAP
ncbi:MAG: DNA polymerase III subunit delta' [bacterium]|nr:DNA polymerase III subunit delta' [bacterium]